MPLDSVSKEFLKCEVTYQTLFSKIHPKCLREGLNPPKGLTFECLRSGFALLQGALLAGNFNREIKGLKLGLSKTMP